MMFEDTCSIANDVQQSGGSGNAGNFDVPLGLVCIWDAECQPMCWTMSDRAQEVADLLNEALAARDGRPSKPDGLRKMDDLQEEVHLLRERLIAIGEEP